jgi:hypothetical protein
MEARKKPIGPMLNTGAEHDAETQSLLASYKIIGYTFLYAKQGPEIRSYIPWHYNDDKSRING